MDAAIACRFTFMKIYSSIEEDLNNVFPDFNLMRLQCVKSFLEIRHREKEVDEDSKRFPPKGAPEQSEDQPPIT